MTEVNTDYKLIEKGYSPAILITENSDDENMEPREERNTDQENSSDQVKTGLLPRRISRGIL